MRLFKVASAFFKSVVDLAVLSGRAEDVSIDNRKPRCGRISRWLLVAWLLAVIWL